MQQLSFFSIVQGYFFSTFQMSYKFVSSNKFEIQVQPNPYLQPSERSLPFDLFRADERCLPRWLIRKIMGQAAAVGAGEEPSTYAFGSRLRTRMNNIE